MPVSGSVGLTFSSAAVKNADSDGYSLLADADTQINYSKSLSFGQGDGVGQVDELFTDTRTLAASTSEDLDLHSVLKNHFGDDLILSSVKALVIYNTSTTDSLYVGGAAANAWYPFFDSSSDIVIVSPLSPFITWSNTGLTVTAGSADKLKIDNRSGVNSLIYDILILGVSD